MLFNSSVFLLFATVFFLFWQIAKRNKNILFFCIIIFSFIFYGWWNWRYLFLLIGSGCIDFFAGYLMYRHPRSKNLLLLLSILGNLGSLAIFKYGLFFAQNAESVAGLFGIELVLTESLPTFLTVLPVGISFYTFQSMSYTFDIYRGELKPTRNILHFFAYLSMFPQLVAGPIVRARDLLHQLDNKPQSSEANRWEGTQLIATGYFMKMVLADNLASYVNRAFGETIPSTNPVFWWLIIIAFSFQIYFDFAGYSRIARGLARWMGYKFPQNFNHPYVAISLQDFWQRWHITLSTWFRDYVYFPLGGSRKGELYAHLNIWVVMLTSGLWHGPAWNFVIWGAVHAGFYSFERLTDWSRHVRRIPRFGSLLATAITMTVVLIAWVFFRSADTTQSIYIIRTMLGLNELSEFRWSDISYALVIIVIASITFEVALVRIETRVIQTHPVLYRRLSVVSIALLFALSVFLRGPSADFIYFQF